MRSTALALQDLSVASSRGHAMATRLLAMGLLSGVGVWGGGAAVVGHKAAGGWRSGARPDFKAEVGNAALEAAAVMQRQQAAGKGSRAAKAKVLEASSVAVGLLHLAAVLDDAQAQRALGVRYQNGTGGDDVKTCCPPLHILHALRLTGDPASLECVCGCVQAGAWRRT